METQQQHPQQQTTIMAKFQNLADNYNIHFPQEWIEYYTNCQIVRTEQLGTEIPFGPYDWKCIDLDNIVSQCNPGDNGQPGRYQNENYVDIALQGFGMGHYVVLSMTKDGHNFFFREDGGSNGYERMANFQKFQGWNPTLYQPLFSLSQAMSHLETNFNDESFDGVRHFLETHCQKGDKSKINYDAM